MFKDYMSEDYIYAIDKYMVIKSYIIFITLFRYIYLKLPSNQLALPGKMVNKSLFSYLNKRIKVCDATMVIVVVT